MGYAAPQLFGSITRAGRTTTARSITFPLLAAGGRYTDTFTAVDPNGLPPQIGDACTVSLADGSAWPAGMSAPVCSVTSTGVVTVVFSAALAVAAGSLSYFVFWRG